MIDGQETTWQGFLLCAPDQIAFLEPEDLSAKETDGRSPAIVRQGEFESCTFAVPESFSFPGFDHFSRIRVARSTDGNGYMFLTTKGRGSLNIRFREQDLSEGQVETRDNLKDLIGITELVFLR